MKIQNDVVSDAALTNCTNIPLSNGVGTLPVANGGSGLSSTTAYGVICGGTTTTGALQNAGAGTTGQVLTSNGAAALPTWQAVSVTSFTSSQQTITFGGQLTIAHGLGSAPKLVTAQLVCQTDEGGYSAGDVLNQNVGFSDGGSSPRGLSVISNSTNLVVRFGSSGLSVIRADDGNTLDITAVNWKVVFYAQL